LSDQIAERVEELLAGPFPAPIVTAGDPVLRTPTVPYDGQLSEKQLDALIELLHETMTKAPGVGVAAPQIGLPLRIAVVEDRAEPRPGVSEEAIRARELSPLPFRVLVNPRYEGIGERDRAFFEGCLSIPGWQAVTARYGRVRLTGQDERGRELDEEVSGWPARIVQHETDHLDGVLYLDRAEIRSLSTNEKMREYWADPVPVKAAEALGFELPRSN
jgi:peptide deformylase